MFLKVKKGFTLIELLIVIGIISILAGIVLVAVNPAQQFGKANDSERKSEISSILSAIYQYVPHGPWRLAKMHRGDCRHRHPRLRSCLRWRLGTRHRCRSL